MQNGFDSPIAPEAGACFLVYSTVPQEHFKDAHVLRWTASCLGDTPRVMESVMFYFLSPALDQTRAQGLHGARYSWV